MANDQQVPRENARRYVDIPVYQHATSSVEGVLNKSIACREMFEQVFILYIIHLHSHMLEAIEQALFHW